MKTLIIAALAAMSLASLASTADARFIGGYYKKDGSYTNGHFRSDPNGTCFDNYGGC